MRSVAGPGAALSDYTMKLLKAGRTKGRLDSALVPELRKEVEFVLNQIRSNKEVGSF